MRHDLDLIAKRLKNAHKDSEYSIDEIAKACGVARQTVINWEKGKAFPNISHLTELCKLYDCDIGYLFCEYDELTRHHQDIEEATGLSSLACANLSAICKNAPDKIDPQVVAAETDLMDWVIGRKAKFHLVQFLLEDNGPITAEGGESKGSLLEALSVAIYKFMRYSKRNTVLSWNTDGELLHYSDYAEIALDIGVNKLKQAIRDANWDVSSWEV